jgi:hypothetical protein
MAVDGSGRVHLLGRVRLLHPQQQTLDEMLDGWRNQQLSRNLKFDTIDQRIRYVRRFVDHIKRISMALDPATTAARPETCWPNSAAEVSSAGKAFRCRPDDARSSSGPTPGTTGASRSWPSASEQRGRVIEAFIALANTVIIPRREARETLPKRKDCSRPPAQIGQGPATGGSG